jgi:KRAB domain-containing zinc finger protein
MFICDVCGYQTKRKNGIKRHIETVHAEQQPCPCPVCLVVFKRQDLLNSHLKTAHGEKNVMCPTCGKMFTTVKSMNNHSKSCGKKIYQCEECPKVFSSRGSRSDHVRTVHKLMVFPCECGRTYHHRNSLSKHKQSGKCEFSVPPRRPLKGVKEKKEFPCRQCAAVFKSYAMRYFHVKEIHEGHVYQCGCGRTFVHQSSFRNHRNRGNCGKEYKCDQCHMTFPSMKERFDHKQQIHHGTVYHCDCGKTYWRQSTMNLHKQSGKCPVRQISM